MATYACRPDDGSTNTANDAFTDGGAHDFADFGFANGIGTFDIVVETNDAIVEFRPEGGAWGDGDEHITKVGETSISFDDAHEGIRIRNRTVASGAEYQITAYPYTK